MANIDRVRLEWSGFPGAPGVTTLYCTSAVTCLPAIAALFNAFEGVLPVDVTITFPTSGDTIDPLTGVVVASWAAEPIEDLHGEGAEGYAAPVGFMINWATGTIIDGKRLRGRTYIVPCTSGVFAADGSIVDATLTGFRATVTNRLADMLGNLVIWHRPTLSRAGGYTAVSSGTVPDKAAVLRSRRD